MSPTRPSHTRDELVQALARAVRTRPCATTRCKAVEDILADLAEQSGSGWLEDWQRETLPDRYARHPVYEDPDGDFAAIAMVWGPDQGTPIHDHGGLWCVECVLEGTIEVLSYRPVPSPSGRADFQQEQVIRAGVGEAGHLVPPFDHHVIRNPTERPAITLHVYGGPMTRCTVYRPHPDGGFEPESVQLGFDA